jgi:hypothetical protein
VVVQGEELGEEHFGNAVSCNGNYTQYYANSAFGSIAMICSSNMGDFVPSAGSKVYLSAGSNGGIYEINSILQNGVHMSIDIMGSGSFWSYWFTVRSPVSAHYINPANITIKTQTSFPDPSTTTTSWEETCS